MQNERTGRVFQANLNYLHAMNLVRHFSGGRIRRLLGQTIGADPPLPEIEITVAESDHWCDVCADPYRNLDRA